LLGQRCVVEGVGYQKEISLDQLVVSLLDQ
jgi:hypothetical protein